MKYNRFLLFVAVLVVAAFQMTAAPRLPKRQQDWLNSPVSYLITKMERETLANLANDEEFDKFVDRFWEVRNPAPGSGQNEFKEEFFRRVAYANAHYGRYNGSEGWRSDMGKTYILFGRPQTSMNYSFDQELHPCELWFYPNPGLSELPPFFYVMFFERDDVSGFKLYNPLMDGPAALIREAPTKAQAYSYLRGISAELARASLSLIPGEPVDTDNYGGSMESVMILNAIQGYRDMPSYKNMILARAARLANVTSHIEYDVPRATLATLVAREYGDPWLHWQLEVDDPLQAKAKDGVVQYDITARLSSENRLVFERTDSPRFEVPAGSEEALKKRSFLYEDRMPAVPGAYRLTVTARNRATGRTYEATRNVDIPLPGDRPLLSDVLVITRTEADPRTRPFRFAGAKFYPAANARVHAAAGLHILYQLTAAEPRPTEYEVEYLIGSVSTKFRKTFQDRIDLGKADAGSILTAKTLSIEDLPPGPYQVVVRIGKGTQAGAVTAASASFTVLSAQDEPVPIVVSRGGTDTPQWSAVTQYERALCWLAQNRTAEALASLESSWKLYRNPVTKGLLEHLYEHTGQKSKSLN